MSEAVGSGQSAVGSEPRDGKSDGLPSNWFSVPLGNVAQYINGRAFKPSEWENSGLPIIRIQNLTKSSDVVNYSSKTHEDKYLVENDDVLMAWSATLDVFIWKNGPAWLNQHIFNVKEFPSVIEKNFLYFALKRAISEFYSKTHGTGMVHVTKPIFEAHEIPLPPLNEQKRIVAKLDAIMPRIEAVKERLDKVPGILKLFRQSVLSAAVTGKLTEQWREEHPGVESAEELVQSLSKKRLVKCFTPVQKQKINAIYNETEVEDDNSLPESWRFTFLSKICESFQYGTSAKSDKKGKVVVLRMGNLQNGKIDWSDLAYTSDDKEIEKYLLEKNAVLFNRTNSPELVGKTSIYNDEQKAIFAGYLIRINNYSDVLDSHYLNFALNTGYARRFCHREKTDGVSQSNINAQKLAHFELPLPPLEEQKEIVRQVDKLFALADKVEAHYQKAKARVDKLSQSVLAKAFRGELVSQDPDDEPAEELLERILEEKAKLVGSKKSAGVRKSVSRKLPTANCKLPTKKSKP